MRATLLRASILLMRGLLPCCCAMRPAAGHADRRAAIDKLLGALKSAPNEEIAGAAGTADQAALAECRDARR